MSKARKGASASKPYLHYANSDAAYAYTVIVRAGGRIGKQTYPAGRTNADAKRKAALLDSEYARDPSARIYIAHYSRKYGHVENEYRRKHRAHQ